MANKNKQKGDTFERNLVDYLREVGHPGAIRAYGAGRPDDCGDIHGIRNWILQAKNHQAIKLAEWVDQTETQRHQYNSAYPANPARYAGVVIKRRNHPISKSYVVLTLEQWAKLTK